LAAERRVTALAAALGDYLALRRSLGYTLERAAEVLADFVAYLDRVGAEHITVDLALDWAMRVANPDSSWPAQRLGMVRCFARYLHTIDPDHQVPPPGLLHRGTGRPEPFLFSEADIVALMAAAGSMASPLRALTMETLIGLLAVTGLRVGEVIRLTETTSTWTAGCWSCGTPSSAAPVTSPSTSPPSRRSGSTCSQRDELFAAPRSPALFISTAGTRLRSGNLRATFAELLDRAGLPSHTGRQGPRVGDMRHSFAVQTLLDWHDAQVDVGPRLPLLSTFLGHVSPASTYWYLSASPPLLATAARRVSTTQRVTP
jgi:integrase/recombinase XerD